jgi:hypothetical protein
VRLPFIKQRIAERLVPRVRPLPEPELAVCLGAALAHSPTATKPPSEPHPEPPSRPLGNPNRPPFDWS